MPRPQKNTTKDSTDPNWNALYRHNHHPHYKKVTLAIQNNAIHVIKYKHKVEFNVNTLRSQLTVVNLMLCWNLDSTDLYPYTKG